MSLYDQLLAKFLISIMRKHPFQDLKEQLLIIADYLHTNDHPAARWLTWTMNNVVEHRDHISVSLDGGCELAIHGVLDQNALAGFVQALGERWKGFGPYAVDEVEIRIRDHRDIIFTAYFKLADYA